MYSTKFALGLAAWCAAGLVFASIDLSDFDTDVMQAMEDAGKELDSGITDRDAQVVAANAELIRDSLQWVEGYFARKAGAGDAVELAKQSREFAAAIVRSAGENNFEAAADSYASLVRTCKSCHDVYKPPSL